MKSWVSFVLVVLVAILLVFAFTFPALAETGTAPAPITLTEWVQANLSYVLGFLLALSELMAVTPWFKGNGLLDSIIKWLKYFPRSAMEDDQ